MRKVSLQMEQRTLLEKCWIAESYFSRLMGLMGKPQIPDDEAVCFPKCNSIHTFFMRFPIDVVYVNKTGQVVELVEAMRPWRFSWPKFKATHVIEMGANRCRELGIEKGAQLVCEGVWA